MSDGRHCLVRENTFAAAALGPAPLRRKGSLKFWVAVVLRAEYRQKNNHFP
jgi:hypothetical protein